MTDLAEKLGSPRIVAYSIEYHDRARDGVVKSLKACEAADAAMAMKGAPAAQREALARTVASLTASIAGALSGIRHVLGSTAAEAALRQAMIDTGLDITRGRK